MADVILYIAHSVDGFIADRTGGIGWLKPFDGYDFGYDGFFARVDAVVMGRKTYQDCRGFGEWPYPGRSAVVMTKGRPVDGDGLAVFDDRTPQETPGGGASGWSAAAARCAPSWMPACCAA